ncbi:unnamed protein product [Urochloa decumbens]|uniref:CCHC-type domain-containing protein n=1 Tax=Urochloa decumbens TaxID=240449 RepID=A0ABC8YU71_9POAL
MGDRGAYGAQRPPWGGGRYMGNQGRGGFRPESNPNYYYQGQWDNRRGNFRGDRFNNHQWNNRGRDRNFEHEGGQEEQFDLRQNMNQTREKEAEGVKGDNVQAEEVQKPDESANSIQQEEGGLEKVEQSNKRDRMGAKEEGKREQYQTFKGPCAKCGKLGHKTEDCYKPVICGRCKREGHVPRVCPEVMPWECLAPFCGLAAQGQGFHIIQDEEVGDPSKDMANWALITVKEGVVSAKEIENEFKTQAGHNSTWRWFAKKLSDNMYQMKFPTAQKVEDLAFFTGMQMRTVPNASIKIDKWNPHVGAKGALASAWFRIFNIPVERRSEKKVCQVASLVGIPLEVDKGNLKRWEYVRVRIGCKDITKVPATVEGLLDFHFYDFIFQREVVVEGATNASGNVWTRKGDNANEENPSPKKLEGVEENSPNSKVRTTLRQGPHRVIKDRGSRKCVKREKVGTNREIYTSRMLGDHRLTHKTSKKHKYRREKEKIRTASSRYWKERLVRRAVKTEDCVLII